MAVTMKPDGVPDFSALPGSRAQKEILTFATTTFERAKSHRVGFERQWYLNLAFFFGRHYVQWGGVPSSNIARLVEPKAPPWRVRLVSNKIRPIVRRELAKVTKEKPQVFVIPSSSDDEDILAAKAAENIYEHLWRDLEIDRVFRRTLWWSLLCGTSFIKDWYDPGTPDSGGVQGKIFVESASPFHLFVPDPQEEEVENQGHITHCIAKDPEWVSLKYKKDIKADSNVGREF